MEHLLWALLGKSLNSTHNLPTRDPFMKTNSMSVFDFARIDYVTILLPFSVKHLKALKNPSLLKLRDGGMSKNLVGASSNVVCMDTANLN